MTITKKESARSGLKVYQPDDTLTPYFSIMTRYQLTPSWSVMAHAHYQYLIDRIKDSPMVSNRSTGSIMPGVGYHF